MPCTNCSRCELAPQPSCPAVPACPCLGHGLMVWLDGVSATWPEVISPDADGRTWA